MATPIVIGNCVTKFNQALPIENFNDYDVSDLNNYNNKQLESIPSQESIPSIIEKSQNPLYCTTSGPMDSPWPMYCYDARHTGRSLYSTASNPGFEKWWYKTGNFVEGSGAIDTEGVIYFGSRKQGKKDNFFALYPDGTLKWSYDINGNIDSTGPAIDENGIIYIGTAYNTFSGDRLFAFYPDGTVKWTYFTGKWIFGSPVIGNDGTIYFAATGWDPWHGYIYALYPNGTLRWKYKTNYVISSDPAIGLDGTVYCGCDDGKLYALFPDNGTLKWKFSTGDWVGRGPCIADDGMIIFGSWDGHLYACYPNGTLKWKTRVGAITTPVLGSDGTIYVGSDYLSAVNPEDGTIKWSYDVPGDIRGGNPCVSADGIIYCGTIDPGYLVAVNPDGSERWRKYIGECHFAPVIGEDGTVYVGSSNDEYEGGGYVAAGYLHAFNELDSDAPSMPSISGPDEGRVETKYEFSFSASSPLSKNLSYFVDWGDWSNTGWIGPYESGEIVVLEHAFLDWPPGKKVYTVRVKARDEDDRWSPWGYHEFNRPRNRARYNSFCLSLLDRFPNLLSLLRYLLDF